MPALIAGMCVLVVLAGPYSAPALVAWAIGGLATQTRTGERFILRRRGFRTLTDVQCARLPLATAAAQARTELAAIDWYVVPAAEPNAYAAGRRAVAVSTGLLTAFEAGRLTEPMLRAILIHELGHHATAATRYGLTTSWLASPWRVMSRLSFGCIVAAHRHHSSRPLAVVAFAVAAAAVGQAAQRGDCTTAAAIAALGCCLVAVPLLDAAIARRGERAADRFTRTAGAGVELASALSVLGARILRHRSMSTSRIGSRHPAAAQRIAALGGDVPDRVRGYAADRDPV